MSVSSGLLTQLFGKAEASYGTIPTIAAANGFRANGLLLSAKNNREPSKQRRGSRGYVQSLPRRPTATWSIPASPLEPSGTLGTPGYFGFILSAGFGTETTPNLATTIASGAAATGATLTSVTGLNVNDVVFVTMTDGSREATRIKTKAGSVVTWDALSATPAATGAVVASVCYALATDITDSFALWRYFTDTSAYKQAMSGCIVDQMTFEFDGTTEATFAANGPGKQLIVSGSVAAKPSTHTTVGSSIGGLVGVVNFAGAVFPISKCTVSVANKVALRNNELGTTYPSGMLPTSDFMEVKVTMSFWMENTALITAGQGSTLGVVRLALGSVNGSMIGAVMPSVMFEIPDIPDETGGITVTAEGMAYDTAGQDSLYLSC